MSYDDNNIKSRNSQIYFDSINKERKKKLITKNSQKFHNKGSQLNHNKNKIEKVIVKRREKKQLTIGPLSSTLESTLSSSKPLKDDENPTITSDLHKQIAKKLIQPIDEDMIFLFDILFKNKQHNQVYYNLRQTTKPMIKRQISNETIDYKNKYYNYNNIYNLKTIKKYLVKLQKKYNLNGNIIFYTKIYKDKNKRTGNIMDYYNLQKIEDLIARYSLIIFVFIKSRKIKEAKEIFLLMLKENINNLNNLEKQICIKYLVINRKVNIYSDIPKITYQLAKIYSFIIKYSQLFHMTNYRNIFMDKYFQILQLNYNFYMIKGTARGFSIETRNQIKYWFSYCFHNCSYYTIYNYFSLRIPIILNYNILTLYKNCDDNSLSDSEKSLIIKTSYNQGVLYYINGQKDEALLNLNKAKEKVISFSDDYYAYYTIEKKRTNQNLFKKQIKENIIEIKNTTKIKKKSTINPFKIKFIEEKYKNEEINKNKLVKIKSLNKSLKVSLDNNIEIDINNLSENSNISKKQSDDIAFLKKDKMDELKSEIYKGFEKDKVNINDLELLLKYGKGKGLLKEEKGNEIKGLDFLFKYKESFSAIKKKITLPKGFKASSVDFHSITKIKDFSIPERFKNPLVRKIELLMSLIELDKKNFEAAYEHVLKVLYIVILLKLSNIHYQRDFFVKQIIEINEYFRLIEDLYDIDLKNKNSLEKCSSNSITTINDRNSINNISNLNVNSNLSNSVNTLNNSLIPFENKLVENNYYQNYINSLNNDINGNIDNNYNYLQNNYNNYNNNYDIKIIKEFEKFFIFLNNLSIYQIKILNETQPDNEKRNHLPIMFTNQFKDCLSKIQRIELDNLQTMALSRFIILKDPNKSIFPTNLNYLVIQRGKNQPVNKKGSNHLNIDRYNYIDETFMKTKEYKNYLDIIHSEKITPDIKEFLKKNKNYVFKIIKGSSDDEIDNMINYPYIIIEPIKKYKKKMKKYLRNTKSINYSRDWKKRAQTITHSFAMKKIKKTSKNNIRISNIGKSKKKAKRNSSATGTYIKKGLEFNNCNDYNNYNNYYMNTVENKNNYFKQNSKNKINMDSSHDTFEDFSLSHDLSSVKDE